MQLYRSTNFECSRIITQRYSTSFSMGIKAFDKALRNPIYGIYGFVRYADEIVDTFHEHDKAMLLQEFADDTHRAIERGISLNPVLDSFQCVVREFGIERELIDAFLESMAMDLGSVEYSDELYRKYIYGSAEVVGLMCLRVFTHHSPGMYDDLVPAARALGAAFQKVNFLRDLQDDYQARARTYFPGLNLSEAFTQADKCAIEEDIRKDFAVAYKGVQRLPRSSRLGVMTAYWYYANLLSKIQRCSAERILNERVRVGNVQKVGLLCYAILRNKLATFAGQ